MAKLGHPGLSPRQLRLRRSVEVLERAGTDEARRAIEEIGNDAPGQRLRQEAKASLERLDRRRAAGKP